MKTIFKIGKNIGNDILVKDESCLDFHGEVNYEKGYWILKNLDQRNPIYLNGQKLESPTYLNKQDKIKIGRETIYWSNYLFEGEDQEFDFVSIFSINGRLSRSNYRALTVLAIGLTICVFFSPGLISSFYQPEGIENFTQRISPFIYLIGFYLIGIALLTLSIKRMRDTGHPLWKILIPLYNLKILYFEESRK